VPTVTPESAIFDGDAAYQFLEEQMEFGPRWPGSTGHQEVGNYIVEQLRDLGWLVEEQRFAYQDIDGRNIIGRANEGAGPVIILGAHYDSRKIADKTPGSIEPVPGAVDGASGVAVLLELARTLDIDGIEREIWLAFFDVEDNGSGGIPGFDWIVGSTYMANNLEIFPQAMILVDMIGDSDQQLYYEGNSDIGLQSHLWKIALDLGYGDVFIPEYRHTMIDDHLPFARRGIPAVDIIDFDYPYWHTVEDTADKASPESLTRVGRTLETWLESRLNR
jgi:Zn-dependent M28 family amino/carboxypeptidase